MRSSVNPSLSLLGGPASLFLLSQHFLFGPFFVVCAPLNSFSVLLPLLCFFQSLPSFYHFPLSTSFLVVLHWFLTLRCPVDGFSHRIASIASIAFIAFIASSDSVAYLHSILNPIRLFSFSCYRRLASSVQYPIDIDRAIPKRRTACRPQASSLCSFSLLDSEH